MNRPGRKISIGRDHACDIPLGDESVSARHAELTFLETGKLLLTDCKSTNGTFVIESDGSPRRIRQELVSATDRVRFGAVTLGVRELLETLRLGSSSEVQPPMVQGRRLVRCPCGCVKPEGAPCPECGR